MFENVGPDGVSSGVQVASGRGSQTFGSGFSQTGTQGNSQQGSGFNQQQGNSHQGSGSNQQQGNAQGSGFNQRYEPGAIYENNSCGPNGCVSSGVQVADGLPQGKHEINASITRAYYFKMFQKSQCLLAVMK